MLKKPPFFHATDLFESSLRRIKKKQERDKERAKRASKEAAPKQPRTLYSYYKRKPQENTNPNSKSEIWVFNQIKPLSMSP